MKLTEAKLKQLINEEYNNMLFESSIKSALPPIEIKDLIPKAKEMKATKGNEDLKQEDGGLSAMLIMAMALALPKILQWMGKAAKTFFGKKKVYEFIAKKIGVEGTIKLDTFIQLLTTDLGNMIHGLYLNLIRYSLVKPILLLARAGGEVTSKEKEDEIVEILFVMTLAVFAIVGVSAGLSTIVAGKVAGHGVALSIEGVTSAIKAFETTEYAGMVPAALKFLETAHEHH